MPAHPPARRAAHHRLTVWEAVLLTTALVLFSFIVAVAPCGGIYFLCRSRFAKAPEDVESLGTEADEIELETRRTMRL